MTNAEKYKEVFGLDPDTNTCPTMNCRDCPYRKDNDDEFPECFNSCSGWWLSEYKTERPQGEWLDEKFVAFHLTCNKCGCNIRRQKEEVFEGDYSYNFCPNCGADMKGGAE